jgi:hypothetical protein
MPQYSTNVQYDQSMNNYMMYNQNMLMAMQYMSMMGYQPTAPDQSLSSNLDLNPTYPRTGNN